MELDKAQKVITIVPTVNTSIYADKDQLCALPIVLTDALDDDGATAKIVSVVLIDAAIQSAAIDLMFFNAAPTLTSGINDALAITDAEMAAKFVGRVALPSASYVAQAGASDVTVNNINLLVQGKVGSKNLYVLPISRGTPTYVAATDLTIRIAIEQD
jgi:hypothetical protein